MRGIDDNVEVELTYAQFDAALNQQADNFLFALENDALLSSLIDYMVERTEEKEQELVPKIKECLIRELFA